MYLEDYPDSMPDLEDNLSTGVPVRDQPGATPANTMISTDMEAAGNMLNLSMGTSNAPESHRHDKPDASRSDVAPSDDEQFQDMFKVPDNIPECQDQTSAMPPGLDFWALMAEAQFKYGHRTLPPPPELRACYKYDKDTRNVIVKSLQKTEPACVPVANPRNTDPLDLLWDASQDAMLEHMKERRWKESLSSSTASRSSSASKRHRSSSRSGDETNPKKGCTTLERKPTMPKKGIPLPPQQSLALARKFVLNWDQDILELLKPKWRPAARDALATPQHKVQSVMQPTPDKMVSTGRGWVITEKLKEMAMGPAARSRYTGKENTPKKPSPMKSGFLTREEMEAWKRHEAQKDRVCNHQKESIGERYFALKQ